MLLNAAAVAHAVANIDNLRAAFLEVFITLLFDYDDDVWWKTVAQQPRATSERALPPVLSPAARAAAPQPYASSLRYLGLDFLYEDFGAFKPKLNVSMRGE